MGELGGDGLAEQQAAGALDLHDQRRVRLRAVVGIDRRAVFGRHVGGVEDVLERDRQAAQRLVLERGVALLGLARAVEIERDEGVDLRLARGDRLRALFDQLRGRQFAGLDAAGQIEG